MTSLISINDMDSDSTNEIQLLSISGDTIFLSRGGGFVPLEDNDSINEIQTLSISNDTIFLTDGGFVMLPVINDDGPSLLLFTAVIGRWPDMYNVLLSGMLQTML